MQKHLIIEKITVAILGFFFFIVLLEFGLRIGGFAFSSLQKHRNMISIKQKGTYRILCLGESSTAIGGKNSYPSQLEEILNQRNIGIKFSVINRGIPATNTTLIVSQLEDNLNIYAPDMVIAMMGANDVWNSAADKNNPIEENALFLKSFKVYKLVRFIQLHIVNKGREIVMQPNNLQEQEKILKEAIEINPENHMEYIRLGLYYWFKEEYDKLETTLKKAIENNPENYRAYIGLAWHYSGQGEHAKAEATLNKAIEINPENDMAYIELGQHYNRQGEYAKAEATLNKAIEINPENDGAHIELGWCYRLKGDYVKAEAVLKKAIEINPEHERLYGILAQFYEERGESESAKEYFRKANRLRLEIYNPITHHNYQRLKEIVTQRGIRLACVQYPRRNIAPLKKMFRNKEGIIFVDNEWVFEEALNQASYDEYFTDMLGGCFGHCTRKGNRLLADNIANVILKECFNK